MQTALQFIDSLNTTYARLHKEYERLFWISYMGDHTVDKAKDSALAKRDAFRSDLEYVKKINKYLKTSSPKIKKRFAMWLDFFSRYQAPPEVLGLKRRINLLESKIHKGLATRKEGYVDPYTKKFIVASSMQMRTIIGTNSDEKIRKACFEAREKMATDFIEEYVEMIKLRNQFAQTLGYEDFYDYKVRREDGMTKKELFAILDPIYEKTKYAFADIRKLEKNMPGLRKPWNFSYMLSGDFAKEEDPFFQFDEALLRWGRSFAALGVDFRGGTLTLDLIDRKGKYSNGFCHWPELVTYNKGKRIPGASDFTCNVVFGQVASGKNGYVTLFHEGGHAAHLLNSEQLDVCVNHEYSPMSVSWAETQSMFMDTLFSSIEWKMRYAVNAKGSAYPFDLFERRTRKLAPLRPLGLNHMLFISTYEREIYEAKHLDANKVKAIARKNFKKYFDYDGDSLAALNVPHIYSWESSAYYHGYALADIALEQWREYFYKKYGYIVDNRSVGTEMSKVWKLAAAKSFKDFVLLATGKKLRPDAYLKEITATSDQIIKSAKERIKRLERVHLHTKAVDLKAEVFMVHGKKKIADNRKSFEDMALKYKQWLSSMV